MSGDNAVDPSFRICRYFDGPAGQADCIASEGEASIPEDATQVYFTTTGGIIEGSAFTDDLGCATVQLVSTGIAPTGQAQGNGFANITANTLGIGGENVVAQVGGGVLFSGSAQISIQSASAVGDEYVIEFTVPTATATLSVPAPASTKTPRAKTSP